MLAICILLGMLHHGDTSIITNSPRAALVTPAINGRNDGALLAINPTTVDKIGINPIESDLADSDTYIRSVYGTETHYITPQETSTKVEL
jgi:hypothetical protein